MKAARAMLGIALAAVIGCSTSTRVSDFTLLSTKNLGVTLSSGKPAHGEDCAELILFVPLGSLNPSIEEATERAYKEVAGADMLLNVTVTTSVGFYFFYTKICQIVDGTAVASSGIH